MEASDAIYTQVLATIVGDSGGLGGSGNASYLRQVCRSDDSEILSLSDRPRVAIEISTQNRSPIQANTEFFVAVVNFIVTADRDPGPSGAATVDGSFSRGTLGAVVGRIMTVFDRPASVLTALVDADDASRKWFFNPMFRLAMGPPDSTSKSVRQVVSYRLYLSKGLT